MAGTVMLIEFPCHKIINRHLLSQGHSYIQPRLLQFTSDMNELNKPNQEAYGIGIPYTHLLDDITEELLRKVAERLCVSSTIRVSSDRLMEYTEEIYVEREKETHKIK